MNAEEAKKVETEKVKTVFEGETFVLPDTATISEWFSADHKDRLRRLAKGNDSYDKYSVYERYDESKGPL